MIVENTKTFQKTSLFKFLAIIFAVLLMSLSCSFLLLAKPNIFVVIAAVLLILIVAFGFLVMVSEKIVVTSDAIVSANIFKKRIIPFDAIKLIKIGRIRHTYLLYVFTEEAQNALNYGATEKQLRAMMQYILEKIRLNDPEHYESINSPQNEVAKFWRE